MNWDYPSFKVNLIFKILESGQARPYYDTKNVVEITNKSTLPIDDKMLEVLILQILYTKFPPRIGTPIDSAERVEKIGENKFRFTQVLPFTD